LASASKRLRIASKARKAGSVSSWAKTVFFVERNEIGMTGSATPDNENTPIKRPLTFNNLRVFPEEAKP
jgi:hypothetical protein